MHVNIGGTWRQVVDGWVNIDGTWRQLTDMQTNIGGTWRTGAKEIVYGGEMALPAPSSSTVYSANVGNYAVISTGGTVTYAMRLDTLVITTIAPPIADYGLWYAMASAGTSYAIIFPGKLSNVSTAYNASLVRTTMPLNTIGDNGSATSIGNHAMFAGRRVTGSPSTTVEAFNTSLSRSSPPSLTGACIRPCAITFGGYAIFNGGQTSTTMNKMSADCYNSSLVKTSVTTNYNEANGATTASYAIFHNGHTGGAYTAAAHTLNTSLVYSSSVAISAYMGYRKMSGTINGSGMFAGGFFTTTPSNRLPITELYTDSLVKTFGPNLSVGRSNGGSVQASNGRLVFVGGSADLAENRAKIDIFKTF